MQVHCYACDLLYDIGDSKRKEERENLIQKAVCPRCQIPRDERQFFAKTSVVVIEVVRVIGECDVCGGGVHNKKYNLCRNCYMCLWKKQSGYNVKYMKEYRARKNYYK